MKSLIAVLVLPLLMLTSFAYAQDVFQTVDPTEAGFDTEVLAQVNEDIEAKIADGKLAGAIGLIAKGDDVVFAETWGQRDREAELPMTEDTIFRIYSMSKPITSVAAMILAERGQLGLDDPVSKYLTGWDDMTILVDGEEVSVEREITVRDLLRHTSGLTYGFFGNTPVDQQYRQEGVLGEKDLEEMVSKLAEIPLLNQPGSRWHYSVSTDVLGRVVEVASGKTLDMFFAEEIFEPLGMGDTFFNVPQEKQSRLAQMYKPDGEGGLEPSNIWESVRFLSEENAFFSGGGGLCSTARDYLTFCQMLLNKGELNGARILQPETVLDMRSNHLTEGIQRGPGFQFGLGFAVAQDQTYNWGGAAGTKFWIDPVNDMVLIYMVQIKPTGGYDFGGIIKQAAKDAISTSEE